ncbi:hypothetical protein [Streptomyces sp. NPDC014734]|uniref:hypothetical protein n=1 Tax=Streptomyces sp. NPDC014734 TaxID=3364886 RepID=UPI0036FAA487
MRIHRSRHTRGFTVLPNALLQDRRLSYTARGLLADLLSRPDGRSEDGRRMADTSTQGRRAVAKALRELTAFGYYRVDKHRRDDGTFLSEAHVYDTPQDTSTVPDPVLRGSGGPTPGERGANPVKNQGKEPSLPGCRSATAVVQGDGRARKASTTRETPHTQETRETPHARETRETQERQKRQETRGRRERQPVAQESGVGGTGPAADGARGEAVAALLRAIRAEPRLRLGVVEALDLAPLVATWLERGYGQRDLAQALLGGLPARVHSAAALLRDRLIRKLPPTPMPSPPPGPRWAECEECARPIAHRGRCGPCAGQDGSALHPDHDSDRAGTAARGRAKVRAALLAPC